MGSARIVHTLAALAALTAAGCPWPQDNPYDPFRCQQPCSSWQRCFEGRCKPIPDGGTDARPGDAGVPGWGWALAFFGDADDAFARGDVLALDARGDLYVAGLVDLKTLNLGGKVHTEPSRTKAMFVARLDSSRKARWITLAPLTAKSGWHTAGAKALLPAPGGGVYLAGNFENCSIALGTRSLVTASNDWDGFVARLDDGGRFQWSVQLAGSGGSDPDELVQGLAPGPAGELFLAGYFRSQSLSFGTSALANVGPAPAPGADLFLARLSSAGQPRWAVRAGGQGNDHARALAPDGSGGVYMAGEFSSATLFAGSASYPRPGQGTDLFVARLSSSGAFQWVTVAGGGGEDQASALAVDDQGAAHVAGHFRSGTLPLGGTTLASAGGWDLYAASLRPGGGFGWAVRAGGSGDELVWGAAGAARGLLLGGGFTSPRASFGSRVLTGLGQEDLFVSLVDGSGRFAWAAGAGGAGQDQCRQITREGDAALVTGLFTSSTLFFDRLTLTKSSSKARHGFIARFSPP